MSHTLSVSSSRFEKKKRKGLKSTKNLTIVNAYQGYETAIAQAQESMIRSIANEINTTKSGVEQIKDIKSVHRLISGVSVVLNRDWDERSVSNYEDGSSFAMHVVMI